MSENGVDRGRPPNGSFGWNKPSIHTHLITLRLFNIAMENGPLYLYIYIYIHIIYVHIHVNIYIYTHIIYDIIYNMCVILYYIILYCIILFYIIYIIY